MKTTLKDLTTVKENSYFVIETPENTFRIKKEYDDILVISDWRPTVNYLQCREPHD